MSDSLALSRRLDSSVSAIPFGSYIRGKFDGDIPECSKVSHSLILPGHGSLNLFLYAFGGGFSDDG